MVRKLAAVFLLSLLFVVFVATTVSFGADKPVKSFRQAASIPARYAPVYSFPGLDANGYTAPETPTSFIDLRVDKAGEGIVTQIGTTTYDYQHNCTMGRQVEHRAMYTGTPYSTYVHFDWMSQQGNVLGTGRGIGYEVFDISGCYNIFSQTGGTRIEGNYAGYVTIDANNIDAANSWAVPAAHESDDGIYSAKAYFDFTLGGPAYGVFTSDFPTDRYGWVQNAGTGLGNENIWPKIEWDIDGTEQVLHMVTAESGGAAGDPQSLSYYRRVGPYGQNQGTWSNQRLIDTVENINVTVASSPISDKVAIVWNAPADYYRNQGPLVEYQTQYNNDVWFAIATDNGAAWASVSPSPSIGHTVDLGIHGGYNINTGGNLTDSDSLDTYKPYCDMTALWYIDNLNDDYLQIAWVSRRWTDNTSLYRRQGAMFHWNQKTDVIRTVVKADWDTGGACYGHAWGTDAAKLSISECDGKMYISYTQFGDKTHPCNYYDNVNNVVSGYLYITVYDPQYDAWDRAQRVTSIPTSADGCIPGDMSGAGTCNSEYWASMARYGRVDTCKVSPAGNVLDLLYVNDYAPGGCVQTESGVWSMNPVNWVVYPCREAVPEPGYSDDAGGGYGLCGGGSIFVIGTTDDTTFTLTLENFGILDNNPVTIATNSPSPQTTITATPNSGINIPGRGGSVPITIHVTTNGEVDNTTVNGTITVTHQAEGSPRVIPICIVVSDEYVPLEWATLATTCKQLRVYNNGQMSNNASNASLDFMDDADDCATVYLYDASPIVCRDDGGTKKCYFTVYDNDYGSDHAMRQISPLLVDDVSHTDYTYASAEFLTGDSAIGMIVEYFVPKASGDCQFVIEKLKFWNRGEVTLSGVAVGEALDWDIPTYDADHSASDNESNYDASRNLIYQYGCYKDPCDTTGPNHRYGGIASYGSTFKNYMTLENDVYVYSTGPFGNDAPLPSDTMFGLMTGNDGPTVASLDSCEDLFTLVTFDVYDLAPADTQCVVKLLATSKDDPNGADLKSYITLANTFADNHEEIACTVAPTPCDCVPGDANHDGQVNVGDAVYMINYVFKQGPAPTPYPVCSGDANCDCQANVGDAVYIINYVFKQGPPPCACEVWRDASHCNSDPYK